MKNKSRRYKKHCLKGLDVLNVFKATPFLYPLKISTSGFLMLSGRYGKETLA